MKSSIFLKWLFAYPNLPLRIIAALLAAIAIVYFGAKINFFDALLIPSFYYSVGGSFIIALLLINWVHYSLVTLDGKFKNIPPFLRKVILHIIPGFLLPCFAAYLLFLEKTNLCFECIPSHIVFSVEPAWASG